MAPNPEASARSARGSKLATIHSKQLAQMLLACFARLNRNASFATGLRDVRKMHEIVQEIETRYVLGAREEGLSWAQIGARIDLSKQGAQQYFSRDRQRHLTARAAAELDEAGASA